MSHPILSLEDLERRARQIYADDLRSKLEPAYRGHWLIIDVDSKQYVLDKDAVSAHKLARERFPGGNLFTMRVGSPTAYRLGSRSLARRVS